MLTASFFPTDKFYHIDHGGENTDIIGERGSS